MRTRQSMEWIAHRLAPLEYRIESLRGRFVQRENRNDPPVIKRRGENFGQGACADSKSSMG